MDGVFFHDSVVDSLEPIIPPPQVLGAEIQGADMARARERARQLLTRYGLGQFLGFFKMGPTTPASTAFIGAWEKRDAGNKVEFKLTLLAANTGTFVDKKGDPHEFKWKAIDNKTLELEMNSPAKSKFWNDESKSRFTHAISGNDLTLTSTGGQAMRFTKATSYTAGDKKDDAAAKDDDKKKKTNK